MAEVNMENPLQKPRISSVQVLLTKTTGDIKECVEEIKKGWEESGGYQVTDDNQSLQRFFSKLELLLQTGLKEKSSLIGGRKDYWNYFCDQLGSNKNMNDGIRFVKSMKELKTNLGKGRALMRYLLVHHRLADTLQHSFMNANVNRDWYQPRSLVHQKKLSDELISSLYDLNEIEFDLAPTGYDLDAAWPTFARKGVVSAWKLPSRSNSISSLNSIPQLDSLQSFSPSLPPDIDECGSIGPVDEDIMAELSGKNEELETQNKELVTHCAELDAKCKELLARCTELTDKEASLTAEVSDLQSRLNSSSVVSTCDAETETDLSAETLIKLIKSNDESASTQNNLDTSSAVNTTIVDESLAFVSALDSSVLETSAVESNVESVVQCDSSKSLEHPESENQSNPADVQSSDASQLLGSNLVAPDVLPTRTVDQQPDVTMSRGEMSAEALVATVESLQKQLSEVTAERDSWQEELLNVKQDLASANNTLTDQRLEIERLQGANTELESSNELLSKELDETKSELNLFKFQSKEDGFFEKAYQEALKDKADLEEKIREFRDYKNSSTTLYDEKIKQQEVLISELKEKIVSLGNESSGCRLETEKLQGSCRENEETAENSEKIEQVSLEKFKEAEKKVSDLENSLESLKKENETLQVKLTESENNVKDLDSRNNAMKEATKKTLSENELLKKTSSQLKTFRAELECKLDNMKETSDNQAEKVKELEGLLEGRDKELEELRAELKSVRTDRDKVTGNLKDDLEAMTGSVQRREKVWDNVRDSMEREIRTLRFDLNAKISSQKAKIRELEQLVVDGATKPKFEEQKEMIEMLQATVANVKKEQELEQDRASERLDDLKQCLGTAETENFNLRQNLEEMNKALIAEREKQKKESEMSKSDIRKLKKKVGQLLKDKDNLWKKKERLNHERKMRASFHWMDSSDITNCLDCNTEFNMTMRKHHCRECGRVLCWNCCNNWILTAHSGNKERVCNPCLHDMSALEKASSESECDSVDDQQDEEQECSDQTSLISDVSSSGSVQKQNSLPAAEEESNYPQDLNPFTDATGRVPSPGSAVNESVNTATSTTEVVKQENNGATQTNQEESVQDSWRLSSQARAAVSWIATTTSTFASNVLPSARRPVSADEAVKSKGEGSTTNGDKIIEKKRSRSNSGDAFDVFSTEEFSESMMYPPPDPNIICMMIVKLDDFDSREFIEGPSDLYVKAGRSCAVPVFIDQTDATLIWQFSTQTKGIVFSIQYKKTHLSPTDEFEELIPPCRVNSHLKPAEGELQARSVGVYTLFFDNAQSKLTGKKISYRLQARRPSSFDISTLAAENTEIS